jgi:hypothetical protein
MKPHAPFSAFFWIENQANWLAFKSPATTYKNLKRVSVKVQAIKTPFSIVVLWQSSGRQLIKCWFIPSNPFQLARSSFWFQFAFVLAARLGHAIKSGNFWQRRHTLKILIIILYVKFSLLNKCYESSLAFNFVIALKCNKYFIKGLMTSYCLNRRFTNFWLNSTFPSNILMSCPMLRSHFAQFSAKKWRFLRRKNWRFFRRKNWRFFLKNQCYDQLFAKTNSSLSKKR